MVQKQEFNCGESSKNCGKEAGCDRQGRLPLQMKHMDSPNDQSDDGWISNFARRCKEQSNCFLRNNKVVGWSMGRRSRRRLWRPLMKQRGGGVLERPGTAPSGGRDVDFFSAHYHRAVKTRCAGWMCVPSCLCDAQLYFQTKGCLWCFSCVGGKQTQLKLNPIWDLSLSAEYK